MIHLLAVKYFPEKSTNAIVATTDATRLGDNIQGLATPRACSFQPRQRASEGGTDKRNQSALPSSACPVRLRRGVDYPCSRE